VVVTHYGYALIADFYAAPEMAARAWASVLRGVEASTLYCLVWSLVPIRPAWVHRAVAVACGWGMFESAQIAGCRLMFPMDRAPPVTALYAGLCDNAFGVPIYMLTVFVVLIIAVLRKPNGPAA
jgi:hypothetical protein